MNEEFKLEYEEITLLIKLVRKAYDEESPGQNILNMMRENKIPVEKYLPMVAVLDKLYEKLQFAQVLMQGGRVYVMSKGELVWMKREDLDK